MKRNRAMRWVVLLLALAAAVFCALWQIALHDRSELEAFAQAEAGKAYNSFLAYEEMGHGEDYWAGVAAFSAFQDAYRILTENTEKSTNCTFLNEIYGNLLVFPERGKDRISELVELMKLLSENPMAESGEAPMLALCNALARE